MNRWKILPLLLVAWEMFAQDPRFEARASLGSTSFVDEGAQTHFLIAPSARYYFLPRLAVEGEFQYLLQNDHHYDVVVLPSVVWDIRRGRVVPYLSAGLGVIYSSFPFFTTTEKFAQGGVGVKLYWNDHWYVAPEFKAGSELHVRFSAAVGYTWRR